MSTTTSSLFVLPLLLIGVAFTGLHLASCTLQSGASFPEGLKLGAGGNCSGAQDAGTLRVSPETGAVEVCAGAEGFVLVASNDTLALQAELQELEARLDNITCDCNSEELVRSNRLALCNGRGLMNLSTLVCDCLCDAENGCWDPATFCTTCGEGRGGPLCIELPPPIVFTNLDVVGRLPASDSAFADHYAAEGVEGVTVASGIQSYTIPATGTYRLHVTGAEGASMCGKQGGYGTSIRGDFVLSQGTLLNIVVGQLGSPGSGCGDGGAGGGGASCIWIDGAQEPLVCAGAGGGVPDDCCNTMDPTVLDAVLNTTGNGPPGYALASNGEAGPSHRASGHSSRPAGGAGFKQSTAQQSGGLAIGISLGATGADGFSTGEGGFGGGGGGWNGGGGGGGYSGGAAIDQECCSGGGGSYNAGTNQENATGSVGTGTASIQFAG